MYAICFCEVKLLFKYVGCTLIDFVVSFFRATLSLSRLRELGILLSCGQSFT